MKGFWVAETHLSLASCLPSCSGRSCTLIWHACSARHQSVWRWHADTNSVITTHFVFVPTYLLYHVCFILPVQIFPQSRSSLVWLGSWCFQIACCMFTERNIWVPAEEDIISSSLKTGLASSNSYWLCPSFKIQLKNITPLRKGQILMLS